MGLKFTHDHRRIWDATCDIGRGKLWNILMIKPTLKMHEQSFTRPETPLHEYPV